MTVTYSHQDNTTCALAIEIGRTKSLQEPYYNMFLINGANIISETPYPIVIVNNCSHIAWCLLGSYISKDVLLIIQLTVNGLVLQLAIIVHPESLEARYRKVTYSFPPCSIVYLHKTFFINLGATKNS